MSENKLRDVLVGIVVLLICAIAFFPLYGRKIYGDKFNALQGVYFPAYLRQIDPDNYELAMRRGCAFFRQEKWESARLEFDKVLAQQISNLYAHQLRGESYDHLGKLREALEDYDYVIFYSARNDSVYALRGHVRERLGDKKLAEEDFSKARLYAGSTPIRR